MQGRHQAARRSGLELRAHRAQEAAWRGLAAALSKNGGYLTGRFQHTAAALKAAVPIGTAVDGELVAFNADGRPSCSAVQNAFRRPAPRVFFAFEQLALSGKSVMWEGTALAAPQPAERTLQDIRACLHERRFPAVDPARFLTACGGLKSICDSTDS